MSTTLNAEELAAKRWPQYGIEREVCATTIREHSQPIADERDELISCIPEGYMVHSGGNAIEALRFLVASYRVTIDEHNQWRDAANELQKERDELREALELFLSCKITNEQQNEAARIARAALAKATK